MTGERHPSLPAGWSRHVKSALRHAASVVVAACHWAEKAAPWPLAIGISAGICRWAGFPYQTGFLEEKTTASGGGDRLSMGRDHRSLTTCNRNHHRDSQMGWISCPYAVR